ncbi:hypothetical protein PTW32_14345 [Dechloromonas agitata]|uniref:hypothetical protein n=1 Tax=Dechloromonas agitata TaxID=73030 RepID=UPI00237EE0AF|nr:hypothetical protein [Dechloromonas agitata]MDE1546597.1 hypothetical protein [Dechloromonas agitata]
MHQTLSAIVTEGQELAALHQAIERLAARSCLDINAPSTIRHLMSGNFAALPEASPTLCGELRQMQTLLYRLEDSNSEDIGIAGLQRLRRQHGEIIAAHAGNKA